MAIEKSWNKVGPLALLADGTTDGQVLIQSTLGFYVGQEVFLLNSPSDAKKFKVKAVLSRTRMLLGLPSTPFGEGSDISAYLTGAQIYAEKQTRPSIPEKEHERAVFAEEPIVAKRSILVDEVGDYVTKENPFPVAQEPSAASSDIPFNEINSVPADVDAEIISFTVSEPRTKLYRVVASGNNVATYWVTINNEKKMVKRTYYGSKLDVEFVFSISSQEYDLNVGDVVKVFTRHSRPYVGDFEASIVILVR